MNKRTVHLVWTISQLYLLHLLALLVQAVRAKTEETTDCKNTLYLSWRSKYCVAENPESCPDAGVSSTPVITATDTPKYSPDSAVIESGLSYQSADSDDTYLTNWRWRHPVVPATRVATDGRHVARLTNYRPRLPKLHVIAVRIREQEITFN